MAADGCSEDEVQCIIVNTTKCGPCKVYVQGNLDTKSGATVFLTVHDMGSTPRSWINFVNGQAMADVKARAIFMHFAVPGQEEHAADWPSDVPYPTLGEVADDLVCVLDQLEVKHCVAVGEAAGANIAVRFAMAHPNRVYGVCLVKCTSTTAGVMEYIKDKYINFKLEGGKMHQSAYQYLLLHKFGPGADQQSEYVKGYLEDLQQRLNPGNLSRYLHSFVKRTDLSAVLAKELKCDCLLVAGSRAAHLHTVYTMHQAMNRERTTLLIIDNVGDVMSEAPDKVVRGMILFCKGLGVLGGVAMPGMDRMRTLSASMEEADRPRRSSFEKT